MSLKANEVRDTLDGYLQQGFAVLPIWGVTEDGKCRCSQGANCSKGIGKHPYSTYVPNGVKNASRDRTIVRQWLANAPHTNWAIATGEPLAGGGFLVALDCDPRNGGDLTLNQILTSRGELPETVCADTGGSGTHHLFKTSTPMRGGAIGPGLEVKGTGGYILVEPSGHHTGGSYAWRIGQSPDDVRIADAPAWLLEALDEGAGVRHAREGEGTARDTVLGEVFFLAGMLGAPLPDGVVAVKCPWANEHSDGRGLGNDGSTAILPPTEGSALGGFRCFHSHCEKRKWIDVMNKMPAQHVAAAKKKFPMLQAVPEAPPKPSYAAPQDQIDPCKDPALLRRLGHKMTKGGYKLSNDPVNLTTILQYHAQWKGVLAFDEFSQILRFVGDPPWYPDDAPRIKTGVWSDADAFRLVLWFKRYFDLDVNEAVARNAAVNVALQNAINPLNDYLDSLSWDGVPRVDNWLTTYLGVIETDYTKMVGSKWMISAVARAYSPGCKADHVLILEGKQGRGKSTALAALTGTDWFTDTPLNLGDKDSYLSLRGKWVIELAELASLNKADADKAKAFFSSSIDTYRPPYGREMASIPRRCVFAGSVNSGQYLRDETGNRRYWPVECGIIDTAGLAADRDQLWAETIVRYRAGEKWHPEHQAQRELAEGEQENREVEDPWEEPIHEWLISNRGVERYAKCGHIRNSDISELALGLKACDATQTHLFRIAYVMKRLGWKKCRPRVDGVRTLAFVHDDWEKKAVAARRRGNLPTSEQLAEMRKGIV